MIEKERNQTYSPTFIQNLVKSEGALKLTDLQIVSNVITFFFAGSDTTSSALAWTFFLLTQYPSVIEEVRKEVGHLIPEVVAGRLSVEGFMDSIVLTKACFTEATRIYSPAGTIPRPTTINTSYSLNLFVCECDDRLYTPQAGGGHSLIHPRAPWPHHLPLRHTVALPRCTTYG